MFRRAAVSSRLAVTAPLTGATSVTYIIADRRCPTRQIKEIQWLGNRSLRGILVLRYEKHDRCVSTDRVVLFVGTLSRSSILFSVYRVSGKITFSYVQHSSGSVCACFNRFRTSIVRTKLLITYVYINIFVYNIRSVLGITMIDVRKLARAYLRTDN